MKMTTWPRPMELLAAATAAAPPDGYTLLVTSMSLATNLHLYAGSKLDPEPHPVRKPPYYAVRLCAGVTYTMGGIAIDGAGRVLNATDEPIAGLYAPGCATGGLEGGEHYAYIGGLSKSAVTALRAANDIAARLGRLKASQHVSERVA